MTTPTDPPSVKVGNEFYDDIFSQKKDISVPDVDQLDPDNAVEANAANEINKMKNLESLIAGGPALTENEDNFV